MDCLCPRMANCARCRFENKQCSCTSHRRLFSFILSTGRNSHRDQTVKRKKILLSWSSGKDCAWALHVLRQRNEFDIAGLLTTLNSEFDRVAMHGTRRTVLEAQAAAAELPLWK